MSCKVLEKMLFSMKVARMAICPGLRGRKIPEMYPSGGDPDRVVVDDWFKVLCYHVLQ